VIPKLKQWAAEQEAVEALLEMKQELCVALYGEQVILSEEELVNEGVRCYR